MSTQHETPEQYEARKTAFLKTRSRMITNRMRDMYFLKVGTERSIAENPGNYCKSAGLAADERF